MMLLVAQKDSMLLLTMHSGYQLVIKRSVLIIFCLNVDFINVNLSGLQSLNLQAEKLVASALALLVNQRLSSHALNPITGFQQVHYIYITSCCILTCQLKIQHKLFHLIRFPIFYFWSIITNSKETIGTSWKAFWWFCFMILVIEIYYKSFTSIIKLFDGFSSLHFSIINLLSKLGTLCDVTLNCRVYLLAVPSS